MKKRLSYLLSSLLVGSICFITAFYSCSNKPPAKPASNKGFVASPAPAIEQDILYRINKHRQVSKLPPLLENTAMAEEARQHSVDMASHRVAFGHDGLNIRIKNISGRVTGITQVGENVAYGSLTAEQVVNAWLKSPGHRANIEGKFRFTGIGVARDNHARLFFTQIFAR